MEQVRKALENHLVIFGIWMIIIMFFVFALPPILKRLSQAKEVYHIRDALHDFKVDTRFKGEISAASTRSGGVSLIALYIACHTLKATHEHVIDSATEAFTLVITGQMILFILLLPEASNMGELTRLSLEHLPLFEFAAIVAFNIVAWISIGAWDHLRDLFNLKSIAIARAQDTQK